MDKLKLTGHIKDIDLKNKMFKLIDKVNLCLKNYEVQKSEFLNPYEIKNALSVLNYNKDINYTIDGGYKDCERSIVFIYPFYMDYNDVDSKLDILQIDGNFKFKEVLHKDYLGSILGLGIKREKIGDILVNDNFCQVIVDSDISDFLIFNLNKIGKNNVSIKRIEKEDLKMPNINYKEVNTTISSKRLDCVISGIYNISRQESIKYISSERVFVDYEKITSSSKLIEDACLISVRGRGRVIISEIGELTKKEKIKLKIKIIT